MLWWTTALALATDPFVPAGPGAPDPARQPGLGATSDEAVEFVVGGEIAAPLPEIGGLVEETDDGELVDCTAVLVAPDLVLSAGHCWSATRPPRFVRLGMADHATDDGERVAIVEDWRVPDYLETFDVSMYRLEQPSQATPARVLRSCAASQLLVDGGPATVYGYGATDLNGNSDNTRLHRAEVTIEDADCSDLERGCRGTVSPGGELRAGGDGVDTCIGDSGGPLYVAGPDGPVLAGLTSRAALPAPTNCGNGGLYVRVDAIVDWIETTSGNALPEFVCPPVVVDPDEPVDTGLVAGRDGCGCASAAPANPAWALAVLLTAWGLGRVRRGRREATRRQRG